MSIFAKPLFWLVMLALFVAAALVGGPSSGLETNMMRAVATLRADWPR